MSKPAAIAAEAQSGTELAGEWRRWTGFATGR